MAKIKIKAYLEDRLKGRPKLHPPSAGYLASGREFKNGGKTKKKKTC